MEINLVHMIKRVKCWYLVGFLDYIYTPCYISNDGKRE